MPRFIPALGSVSSSTGTFLFPKLTFFGSSSTIFSDATGRGISHHTGTTVNVATGRRSTNVLCTSSELPEFWARFWPSATDCKWFFGLSSSSTPPTNDGPLNNLHGYGFQLDSARSPVGDWYICHNDGDSSDNNDMISAINDAVHIYHFKFNSTSNVTWEIYDDTEDMTGAVPTQSGTTTTELPSGSTNLFFMAAWSLHSGSTNKEHWVYDHVWLINA